jgi:hypothetical protein
VAVNTLLTITSVRKVANFKNKLPHLTDGIDVFIRSKVFRLVPDSHIGSLRGSYSACNCEDMEICYRGYNKTSYICVINCLLKDLYITSTHTAVGIAINKGKLLNATRGMMELERSIDSILNALVRLSIECNFIVISIGSANSAVG